MFLTSVTYYYYYYPTLFCLYVNLFSVSVRQYGGLSLIDGAPLLLDPKALSYESQR